MIKIKKITGISLLLTFMMLLSLNQIRIIYNPRIEETYVNIEFLVRPSGFWNLTGSIIFIDDVISTCDWENISAENDWCIGDGSIENPYIIQDVVLDGLSSATCIEIRNSRVNFVIKNCSISNAEIGIKIENCTNFKIIDNKISDLKGKEGLSGSERGLGGDGEDGYMSMGILINNCNNVNITTNEILNIAGGNGGNGENGKNSREYGGNGGNGANAYGILTKKVYEVFFSFNNISKILAGNGGNGGHALVEVNSYKIGYYGTDGGFGGNGGNSFGFSFDNSSNSKNYRNKISDIYGGKGGSGGNSGLYLDFLEGKFIIDNSGNGGFGGKAIGIYFQKSINIKNTLNTILNINSGDGNRGGTYIGIGIRIGGMGGTGGGAGLAIGIFFNYSKIIENNENQVMSIIGGNGGEGGNGGMAIYYVGDGGDGGQGGFCSGILYNNSMNIKNNINNLQNIKGGKGNYGGNGSFGGFSVIIIGIEVDSAINGGMGGNGGEGGMSSAIFFQNSENIQTEGNDILNISADNGGYGGNGGNTTGSSSGGNGGNGGNGGSGFGFQFKTSINSTNRLNTISMVNGGNNGEGGFKGIGSVNGTDGYNGSIGIGYGLSLIKTNDCLSYLNAIYCQNNLDNGSNNQWNNASYGNYWEYYEGVDLDGNGIGDSPYSIIGSAHSKDYLPLMYWPFDISPLPDNPDLTPYIIIGIIVGITFIGPVLVISGVVFSKRKSIGKKGKRFTKL